MKKIKELPLPIKIIIIGCIIGIIVAGIGGIKQISAKKTNEDRAKQALQQSQAAVDVAKARLAQIDKEYSELQELYEAKAKECDAIVPGSDGWFEKSNTCTREKSNLQNKIWELESEESSLKNRDYTAYYQEVPPKSYQIFYIIGASIAGAAILGAFIIYLVKGKKSY